MNDNRIMNIQVLFLTILPKAVVAKEGVEGQSRVI